MELHSREMIVTGINSSGTDKVRVSLGEVPKTDGTGPGVPAMGGGSFSYEVDKASAPKVWDIQTVSVNA